MSAAELAMQSMKNRSKAVADSAAADEAAGADSSGGGGGAKGDGGGGGGSGEADARAGLPPVPGVDGEGEPPPFQPYTGKDYVDLYGHPDRWACLDSSELYEDDEVLVMKTHSFISKFAAVVVWVLSLACIGSTFWAIYVYINAEQDPVSPRYYQSLLCEAVTMVNQEIREKAAVNETLLLQCDPANALTIPEIGDLFWVIWALLLVTMIFLGCCAPPDRVIVLEKDSDFGYVRERNWNMCSIVCARVHCGQTRTIAEFSPSVVYATFETEKRMDGVGGWGVTRWGLVNPTKVIVIRDLHDGAILHTIDAHDILCCYNPRCCLKEAEYMLVTLKQRLESHLRVN